MPETKARVLPFPVRPTLIAIAAPPCACCLGRTGAGVLRDVWVCGRCAALIEQHAIGVVLDDGVWTYDARGIPYSKPRERFKKPYVQPPS